MSLTATDPNVESEAPEPLDSPAASGGIVFTDRMAAIARGENPDSVETPAAESDAGEQDSDDASDRGVESAPDVEANGEATPAAPWYSQADIARAAEYGMEPYDVEAFPSKAEFQRFVSHMDRQIARAEAAKSKADPKAPPIEDAAEDKDSPVTKDGRINLEFYRANGYDEPTIKAMEALQVQQDRERERNDWLYQQHIEAETLRYETRMHDAFDSLGLTKLLGSSKGPDGKPANLAAAELDARNKILDQMVLMTEAAERSGRQVPSEDQLARLAIGVLYPDAFAAQETQTKGAERQAKLTAIANQSRRRRPVATSVPGHKAIKNSPPAEPNSTAAIFRQPSVQAVLQRIASDNGY